MISVSTQVKLKKWRLVDAFVWNQIHYQVDSLVFNQVEHPAQQLWRSIVPMMENTSK